MCSKTKRRACALVSQLVADIEGQKAKETIHNKYQQKNAHFHTTLQPQVLAATWRENSITWGRRGKLIWNYCM